MATTLPRITTRVDEETQDLLSRAAALAGMSSINSFILNAAVEKAKQIIEREQALKLSARDAKLLVDVLDRPPKSNPALKAAFSSYDKQTQ